jgi:hypothetical protein
VRETIRSVVNQLFIPVCSLVALHDLVVLPL